MAIWQTLGKPRYAGLGLMNRIMLAMVATEQRDFGTARQLLHEVMAGSHERGYHYERIYALEATAGLAAAQEENERAAQLFGAAETLRQVTGCPLPASERNNHQRIVDSARAALGEESFAAAWAAGWSMSLEDAMAFALQESAHEEPSETAPVVEPL